MGACLTPAQKDNKRNGQMIPIDQSSSNHSTESKHNQNDSTNAEGLRQKESTKQLVVSAPAACDDETSTQASTTSMAATPKFIQMSEADADRIKEEVCFFRMNLEKRRVAVNTKERVSDYSILAQIQKERKAKFVEFCKKHERLDRVMGSMCGMGIGDAMGAPFEFLPARDKPGSSRFDLKDMKFYKEFNTFGLKRGQWTDDASMGLCMADSLILNGQYDGGDMRARFWCWWNKGYNNAFRLDRSRSDSVGLGGNISNSLSALSRLGPHQVPPPTYHARGEDAGNGSLMRFTPITLFFHSASLEELYKFARQSSYTTHPGIIAAEACSLLAHLIQRALVRSSGPVDAKQFLETHTAEYMKTSGLEERSGWGYDQMKEVVTGRPKRKQERCWQWREKSLDIVGTLKARGNSYNGYPVSSDYFGSFSLDGLAMAMWAVYHTTSFNEAIEKSINLCGDADSHGSIVGQLAGALYGYSTIHPQFLAWLNVWDEHEFAVRAVLLHEMGTEWANSKDE